MKGFIELIVAVAGCVVFILFLRAGVSFHQSAEFSMDNPAHKAGYETRVAEINDRVDVIRGVDENGVESFYYDSGAIIRSESEMEGSGWSNGVYTAGDSELSVIARQNTPNERWTWAYTEGTTVGESNKILTWIPVRILWIALTSSMFVVGVYSLLREGYHFGSFVMAILFLALCFMTTGFVAFDLNTSVLAAISLIGYVCPVAVIVLMFWPKKKKSPEKAEEGESQKSYMAT